MWDRRAQYIDNYDGDSVTVLLDQGFHDTKEIHIRLANVWAPEMNQPGGPEVQQFIENWFRDRIQRVVGTQWRFIVWVHRMVRSDREQMTFNRYVATVTSLDGKSTLNTEVMKFITDKGYGPGVQVNPNA